MKKCLALSLFSSFTGSLQQRIIGGQEVEPYSIKYQASIQYNNYHYCGGTLIHRQWVVTAAHLNTTSPVKRVLSRCSMCPEFWCITCTVTGHLIVTLCS
uniref:Peptidase S1 domain-containing protein n=1 Tax=Sinocyclocheilus grahami TaxID=75366 RepID=A0A672M443_SINGR